MSLSMYTKYKTLNIETMADIDLKTNKILGQVNKTCDSDGKW